MENLMPADSFTVINKTILKDSDRQILTLLYQPIIGSVATSLYFTLWSFLDKHEVLSREASHHNLMAIMHIDLHNIEVSRKKLEAIGLLKTYFTNDEVGRYVYEIYSPATPFEFFSNPILNTGLQNNIGKSEYERIVSYYRIPNINLTTFKDITSKFSEVFEIVTDMPVEIMSEDIKKFNYRKLQIASSINLEDILSSIPEEVINHKVITKSVKEYIYKLSFIYELDGKILVGLIEESLTDMKTIDIEKLKQNCEKFFKFENKGKLPNLAYKEQPEYLRNKTNGLSNKEKMIYFFETTAPADYLKLKNKTDSLSKSERDILSYLLMEANLNPGVVNVLIDYVLRINENKLTKNFIEAIASQWKRSNIETVEQAMDIALKDRENKEKRVFKTSKTIEKKPDWFEEEIEANNDPDAIRKMNELLKGFE